MRMRDDLEDRATTVCPAQPVVHHSIHPQPKPSKTCTAAERDTQHAGLLASETDNSRAAMYPASDPAAGIKTDTQVQGTKAITNTAPTIFTRTQPAAAAAAAAAAATPWR